MITPEPTAPWWWSRAVTAVVISGQSAARAATNPRSASESPKRSPTRSSRETRSQLVVRLSTAPPTKALTANPAPITTHQPAGRGSRSHSQPAGCQVQGADPEDPCRPPSMVGCIADQTSRLSGRHPTRPTPVGFAADRSSSAHRRRQAAGGAGTPHPSEPSPKANFWERTSRGSRSRHPHRSG